MGLQDKNLVVKRSLQTLISISSIVPVCGLLVSTKPMHYFIKWEDFDANGTSFKTFLKLLKRFSLSEAKGNQNRAASHRVMFTEFY